MYTHSKHLYYYLAYEYFKRKDKTTKLKIVVMFSSKELHLLKYLVFENGI